MTIKFYKEASTSPAWGMIPFAVAELIGEGLQARFTPQHVVGNDHVIMAFDENDKPVGLMAYRVTTDGDSWYILLSYVDPDARGDGHHTRMFEALVARAKERGDILAIECGTHVNNLAAQAAFEKQGRKLTGYAYSYHIRDAADGVPVEVIPENIKKFMEANDKYRMKMFVDNEGIVTITLKDGSTWQMTSGEFDALPGKYPI